MGDNNIHNKDIFGESIKSKLENYQMPLDESVWKGIEKQLAPKQSRIVPFWFWLSGGVAASFLVIFLLNPFKNNNNVNFATGKSVKTEIYTQTKTLASNQQTNALSGNKIQKKSTISIKSRSNIASNISKTYSDKTSSDLENENSNLQINRNETQDINFTDNVSNTEFQANEVNKGLANSVLQVKDSIPAKITEPKLTSLPEIPEILEIPEENPKKKQKNDWLLAANLGTSGNTDFNFSNGDFAYDPQMTASEVYGDGLKQYASAANAYILQPSDYDNVEHLNPVSVGFSIQKSLTPNLSVSSGLVYTYLRSNYSLDNQWQQADASLDLHYVGVPLNLNVMIAEKKHWNYYFSVGAMIEKGLRSVYKQTIQYGSSSTHQTNVYSKIDGVQTSADVAFGVGYKLQKNWSLFFEPKLTYYFKNNQPMSARTETPLNVGFNGGMKVGF